MTISVMGVMMVIIVVFLMTVAAGFAIAIFVAIALAASVAVFAISISSGRSVMAVGRRLVAVRETSDGFSWLVAI